MASTQQSKLTEHPLPFSGYKALGADSRTAFGTVAGNDYLIVPPPPAGVTRLLDSVSTPISCLVTSAGPLVAGDVQVVYKNENGDVCSLAQNPGGEVAGSVFLFFPQWLLLSEQDQGVFLKVNAGSVNVFGSHFDIRNLKRIDVDVTAIFPNTQPLLTNTEDNPLTFPLINLNGFTAKILNFDANPHTLRVFFTDGVNSGEVPLVLGQPVPAGTASNTTNLPVLKKGWSLSVCLAAGDIAPTKPVRFAMGLQSTNLSPVRQDQGGAY